MKNSNPNSSNSTANRQPASAKRSTTSTDNKKPILIYGYYGTGKSTFCKRNPSIYKDYDSQYMNFDENLHREFLEEYKKDSEKVLFINNWDEIQFREIRLIFIPKNKEILEERLRNRNVDEHFIKDMVKDFKIRKRVLQEFANINNIKIIELDNKSYISDYTEEIEKIRRKHHE